MKNNAKFDPGFAPYVYAFKENVEAVETVMRSLKAPHQRRFKYQSLRPQIVQMLENNLGFYKGCLMWAKHLKEDFSENSTVIEDNSFYGVDLAEKNITIDDLCSEVIAVIDYFDKYEKDCKFYLGKTFPLPTEYRKIAEIYKEFLVINNSFVNTKFTSDIILPENLGEIIDLSPEQITAKVAEVINTGNLVGLLF